VISRDSKVRRNPQVVARELTGGDGGVLLHLASGNYHGVNDMGLLIWETLDAERTVGEIVEAIRAQVADPPADLESDVVEFLAGVQERELVVVE
jgi:hypothetical protein